MCLKGDSRDPQEVSKYLGMLRSVLKTLDS